MRSLYPFVKNEDGNCVVISDSHENSKITFFRLAYFVKLSSSSYPLTSKLATTANPQSLCFASFANLSLRRCLPYFLPTFIHHTRPTFLQYPVLHQPFPALPSSFQESLPVSVSSCLPTLS